MISNIKIKNFKSLVDIELSMPSLTLLTGLNNSGKSSVIQAIRMYIQAFNKRDPLLRGHGGVTDLRSKFVNHMDDIHIELGRKSTDLGRENSGILKISNSSLELGTWAPELLYVGADRLGPQSFLPLNTEFGAKPSVGNKGEFVFDFIDKIASAGFIVPDGLVHRSAEGKAFEYVLQGWMSEIAPNVDFHFEADKNADISSAKINNYRPVNVGFGLSYTLPIIAATIGAVAMPITSDDDNSDLMYKWSKSKSENGCLLILENPEAHLHPKGQTAMGEMLALAASCGVQIIVETHSEHIMDGIRIAIKKKLIKHNEVRFNYFKKLENDHTQISSPEIDQHGKLSFWPEGFFDQALKNRAFLAKRGE